MKRYSVILVFAAFLSANSNLLAQNVKVTPLGARTGEFCSPDRALVFEDPTGVRILYDPGTTVAGSGDSRLGRLDAVLVSHAHGDHLGASRMTQSPDASNASCGSVTTVAKPDSNAAEIAAIQRAAFIGSQDLSSFIAAKMQHILGASTPGCSTTNEIVVPLTAGCNGGIGYGAKRILRASTASAGVQVAIVTALHGNALPNSLIAEPLLSGLTANGLSFSPGAPSGYVLTFTNGLRVYLSGDTGQTSDMVTVVRAYYGANLVVLNIGDIFTTGPEEAAFVINDLIRPASVIPSHANEIATTGGVLNSGTKTARFAQLVDRFIGVYAPLSGMTMEFDGRGRCAMGCGSGGRRRY